MSVAALAVCILILVWRVRLLEIRLDAMAARAAKSK
jgi:hypothetical protein